MKLKINIGLKVCGLICAIIVFILGIVNIVNGLQSTLNYFMISISFVGFLSYILEWFVTRAWFRIVYWLIFIIVNPIMLMDDDKARVVQNINSSMFIFSIFYMVIMFVAATVLIYQYMHKEEIRNETLNK